MRIACVQSNVVYGEPNANAASAVARLEPLAKQGVDLAVFTECFLTGYCVETHEEAKRIAIPGDHASLRLIAEACARLGLHAIVGYAGIDGDEMYNGARLIEPDGRLSEYRKTHLPELGLDNYVKPGDSLPVFETAIGRIGIAVCFDLRPPEVLRVLALQGAELAVVPTNWPEGAEFAPSFIAPVRANENRIFVAACNRVGEEKGFRFIGQSGVWDPAGRLLAKAGDGDEVIVADVDLALAREKRIRTIPGKYETTVFESRRPELYGPIVRS